MSSRPLGAVHPVQRPEDVLPALEMRLRMAEQRAQSLESTCDTFANLISSLVQIVKEVAPGVDDAVRIPKELSDRMKGAQVHVREEPGSKSIAVWITKRGDASIILEVPHV